MSILMLVFQLASCSLVMHAWIDRYDNCSCLPACLPALMMTLPVPPQGLTRSPGRQGQKSLIRPVSS